MTEMTEFIIKEKEEEQNRNHESIQESGFQQSETFGDWSPKKLVQGNGKIVKEMVL